MIEIHTRRSIDSHTQINIINKYIYIIYTIYIPTYLPTYIQTDIHAYINI